MGLHIHVGANIPGYLPESDVACFDSADDALDYLHHEIKDQQDYYYESCYTTHDGENADNEPCEWCSVATDCEAAMSAIADGDAAYAFERNGYIGWVFSPPAGMDICYWVTKISDARDDCEIFVDQEAS